jgi:hypothetical protein
VIDWLVDTLLGSWGRPVVDFYSRYSLPINAVIVAYGALLLFLHLRLRPYRAAAIAQVAGILPTARSKARGRALDTVVAARIDWALVAAAGGGRWVAGRWRLWPVRVSASTLPALLPVAELIRDAPPASLVE